MVVSKHIAIIPARGGSKRIPDKNVIDFMGRPMIEWTIEAALQAGVFDRVLVSTDDEDIAQVARECGAEVPFLRLECADDHSPVSMATTAALRQAMHYWGENYGIVAQLMANCPLRSAVDIRAAFESFISKARDFQISCFKFGWMNPWWAVTLRDDGQPSRLFEEYAAWRSQDLPELYCPTGAVWLAKAPKLLEHNNFYGPNHAFEPIPLTSAVDIDDVDDLAMAKTLFSQNAGSGEC
ncbi:cytidylyltransferase domain-containing protein [Salinicola sp. DM10]|uniref:acylneuraminate cytidylyltransferase family protein n=1 Tax=Salinicola sp. DM10 TaxID=2815721 RepID=UPI001A8F365D|nr:acylneuraminate cytidylyltransferase family protein [Salinicola sp. DM10]MCE3025995.1 acylneuraminate cytidylyltransferase family protein [Salinicola sp. DM10]